MVWGSRKVFGTPIGSVGAVVAMVASDEKWVGNAETLWMRLLDNECTLYSKYYECPPDMIDDFSGKAGRSWESRHG